MARPEASNRRAWSAPRPDAVPSSTTTEPTQPRPHAPSNTAATADDREIVTTAFECSTKGQALAAKRSGSSSSTAARRASRDTQEAGLSTAAIHPAIARKLAIAGWPSTSILKPLWRLLRRNPVSMSSRPRISVASISAAPCSRSVAADPEKLDDLVAMAWGNCRPCRNSGALLRESRQVPLSQLSAAHSARQGDTDNVKVAPVSPMRHALLMGGVIPFRWEAP